MFWRGGGKLSRQRRKPPRRGLFLSSSPAAHTVTVSYTTREGFVPTAEHPRGGRCRRGASRATAAEEDGCARPAGGACDGIRPSLLLWGSEGDGSAPGLPHNAKKRLNSAFIRRAQGCKARALAGSLAPARAPAVPYLADGACKTHPVMLSHGAAEDL